MAVLIAGSDTQLSLAARVLRRWSDLKAIRVGWESTWQEVANYFLPRRDFTLQRFPGELRDRRLLDATGMIDTDRLAAMLFGWLISPAMPFVRPSVERGLIAAGRQVELEGDARDWLDGVQWSMFDHFMAVQSGFKVAAYETLSEYVAFGTGILWTGSKARFGARYQSRPLQSCWIAANADDEVDTVYYAFTLPAHRVLAKWPAAAELDCVKRADRHSEHLGVKLLLAVEPRPGGIYGGIAQAKPWRSVLVAVEDQAVLEESGYDSFPYSVPRFYLKPGEVYGYGPGHVALPDVRMLNAVMETILNGAELKVRPPIMAPLRLFAKPIDRRQGAVNYYQTNQLGLQTAEQAVRVLNVAGDIAFGVDFIRELRSQVDLAFYVDWMRLRENSAMTATEVNDRRDMRLRGMGPIVGRAESDLMGPCADRTFEVNMREGAFGQAPASLRGLDVTWGYAGPMALAQLGGQADAVTSLFAAAEAVAQFDPAAAKVVDGEEGLRILGDAKGGPPALLRTRTAMAELRDRQAKQEQDAATAATQESQARALAAGATGVAQLTNALGPQASGAELAAAA